MLHCHFHFDLRQGTAEELPFASGEVDLVTAMTAAHWFDRQKFLQEADRVLRPGGCLALLSYTMDMELEYKDGANTLNDICKEVQSPKRKDKTIFIPVCLLLGTENFHILNNPHQLN